MRSPVIDASIVPNTDALGTLEVDASAMRTSLGETAPRAPPSVLCEDHYQERG